MKQVKPEVIGYTQVEYDGEYWDDSLHNIMGKAEMIREAGFDFRLNSVKSRFRPVYAKEGE